MSDLHDCITRAGYDYRNLYGRFPDKIGVHIDRIRECRSLVIFPEIPVVNVSWTKLNTSTGPSVDIHTVRIDPVVNVSCNDVYIVDPRNPGRMVSGQELAKRIDEGELKEVCQLFGHPLYVRIAERDPEQAKYEFDRIRETIEDAFRRAYGVLEQDVQPVEQKK